MFTPRTNRQSSHGCCYSSSLPVLRSVRARPGQPTSVACDQQNDLPLRWPLHPRGNGGMSTGDEAHVAVNGTLGPNSNEANGTATLEIIYRFKDGSGFTLRGVAIWNESLPGQFRHFR